MSGKGKQAKTPPSGGNSKGKQQSISGFFAKKDTPKTGKADLAVRVI
jgi:hypothetical protein